MFPFTITLKKTLPHQFDEIGNETILLAFRKKLLSQNVDSVTKKGDNRLIIRNYLFPEKNRSNWNLWAGIFRGQIEIVTVDNERTIRYSFAPTLLLIIPFGALIAGIVLKIYAFGLLGCFLLIFAGSLTLVRHQDSFAEVVREIVAENKTGTNQQPV